MICINDFTFFSIIFLMFVVMFYFNNKEKLDTTSQIYMTLPQPEISRQVNKVDPNFPMGRRVYSHDDWSRVGLIQEVGTDNFYNLFLKTYANRYYYYVSKENDIQIELDNSPYDTRLYNGNTVQFNGKDFIVKLYRTSFD